jgi:hypothetical protein
MVPAIFPAVVSTLIVLMNPSFLTNYDRAKRGGTCLLVMSGVYVPAGEYTTIAGWYSSRVLKNPSSVHLPLWKRGIEGDF